MIEVADSKFIGFVNRITISSKISNNDGDDLSSLKKGYEEEAKAEALRYQRSLKDEYPNAAHIPICWKVIVGEKTLATEAAGKTPDTKLTTTASDDRNDNNAMTDTFFDEDGEPENSVGPFILNELKKFVSTTTTTTTPVSGTDDDDNNDKNDNDNTHGWVVIPVGVIEVVVLAIVRSFGGTLLGVTCGRLSQCYKSISRITLHRHFYGKDKPMYDEFYLSATQSTNVYGLGAGDCEILVNVITSTSPNTNSATEDSKSCNNDDKILLINQILNELNFDGFMGAKDEVLPRLQNIQACGDDDEIISVDHDDSKQRIFPIYRYPGNYHGDQWITYDWKKNPLSFQIKQDVENALKPFWINSDDNSSTYFNHCVTNYYRHGDDFIDHHSDKVLDLNKNRVIVSVSLGDERILELKRRKKLNNDNNECPQDVTRINLPHGSILILGPKTNEQFTHSILQKEKMQTEEEPIRTTEKDKDNADIKNGTSDDDKVNNIRISLTMRHSKTFLDQTSGIIFGDGATTFQTFDELQKALRFQNFGFIGASSSFFFPFYLLLVSSSSSSSSSSSATKSATTKVENSSKTYCLLSSSVLTLVSTSLSFLLYRYCRKAVYKNMEEIHARKYFSKMSVTGSKYL